MRTTTTRNVFVKLAVSALCLFASAPLFAGFDTVLAKGFKPNMAYQVNEFDSVNMLSGDLMVHVPLGPTYKTNGALQYSFGLHYTADFWSFVDYYGINQTTPEVHYIRVDDDGPVVYSHIVLNLDDGGRGGPGVDDSNLIGSEAIPTGTAGVGWNVDTESFGAVVNTEYARGGTYVDSSGAKHTFNLNMHAVANCGSGWCNNTVAYTHDGSYLRMRIVNGDTLQREVDLPDGTVKHFHCVARCTEPSAQWNLEWTADPFGNVLLIERTDAGGNPAPVRPAPGQWIWNYIEGTLPDGETRVNPYYTEGDRSALRITRRHRLVYSVEDPDGKFSTRPWLLGVRLVRAELAGPQGDRSMQFIFNYEQKEILRTIIRPYIQQPNLLLFPYTGNKGINVQVLKSISMPDDAGLWQFQYKPGLPNDGDGLAYTYCMDFTVPSDRCPTNMLYPTSRLGGRIDSARAPTGGGYAYDYAPRTLPRTLCSPGASNAAGYGGGSMVGIKTRKQLDADGHEIPGTVWRYAGLGGFRRFIDADHDGWDDGDVNHNGHWDDGDTPICRAPLEFLSSTLDPKGLLTINFYDVRVGNFSSDNLETSGKWFAAPFSPDPDRADTVTRHDGTTAKRYLSMQQYEVDMTSPSATPFVDDFGEAVRRLFRTYRFDTETATTATLRRSNYVLYEGSAFDCDNDAHDCDQYNLRIPSDHARFDDDSAVTVFGNVTEHAYVEHINGDFDGLGHYRQKNTYGNLKAVDRPNATENDWDHHIDYQLFNPNVSWTAGAPNPTGLPSNWIINNFTHTSALEVGRLSSTRYFFDDTRGFLRAARKMEAFTNAGGMPIPPASARDNVAATSADDFLSVFTRTGKTDNDGQLVVVVRETDYGGDDGHLGGWDPQNDNFGVASNTRRDYTIETTYRFGATAKTEYRDCDPSTAFLVKESAFIDPGMGVPLTITDESGLTTNYAHDSQGRITQVSPPGGLTPQTYTYRSKTGPAGMNRLTVERSGGPTLIYDYDYLGRLSHDSHLMPTGATSTTTYTYTTTGRVATEVLPIGTPGSIRYKYDVFDREKHVDRADNKTVDTIYNSIRGLVRKTNGIAVDAGDPSQAQLSKSFDTLGRVWQVSDDATRARYEFDALGDIIHVTLNPAGSSSPLQHRLFDYDGRGVLVTSHPSELRDASGTGWQTLVRNSYDARGHVTATDYIWADPANHGGSLARWQLRFDYDNAERVQKVWQPTSGGQKIFKNFTYYGHNDAPGNRARLKTAVRKNYYPDPSRTGGIPTIDVTTTLAYDACAGSNTTCTGLLKTSSTVASIPGPNGAQAQSFFSGTVGYGFDGRGDLARIDYPEFSGAPSRSIDYIYTAGFLTAVKEGAERRADISYYLNGLTNVIQYAASSASDVITADTSGIPRVGKFDWKWTGGSATSEGYSYDGAGNISAIGPDKFFYDRASRLVRADVGGQSETYAYDGFSNLTGNGARTNSIDSPSNRLKPPVIYDEAGNIAQMPDPRPAFTGSNVTFLFDALNAMTYVDGTNLGRAFVYDASDERIGIIDYKASGGRRDLWSIRDENGRVLRDFARTFSASGASQWTWEKDYVYRGNFLSNTISTAGVHDIHVDHLGSTRFVTDAAGQLVPGETSSGTKYWPFGNLVFARTLDERLAFTGHERDDDGTTAGQADFDYFHARYYSPSMGRFLSMDVTEGEPSDPQSWNRYAYSRNRPLILKDPDGRCPIDAAKESVAILRNLAIGFLRSASHFDDLRESLGTYTITDPPQEQALVAGVVLLSVADLGANFLEPEEGAVEHTIIENGVRGRASEARVLDDLGLVKNTETVTTAEGPSIPDIKTETQIGDIKDTQRLSNTRQMRIQRGAAQAGQEHVVITGEHTKVSRPLQESGTKIIRRQDLGPRRPPQ